MSAPAGYSVRKRFPQEGAISSSPHPIDHPPASDAWVALTRLLRPQGRKGELLAELLTDLPAETQFAAGRAVMLAPLEATRPPLRAVSVTIESHWLPVGKNAGRIVLKLAGCNSISQAELLSGQQLMVPASELPALDEDTFYVNDLIGCTLLNRESSVGEVVDIEFATSPDGKTRLPDAAPLLVVRLTDTPADADGALVPFVRAFLTSVDLSARRISMDLPDGLLDSATRYTKP